jgi:hypothetical protein
MGWLAVNFVNEATADINLGTAANHQGAIHLVELGSRVGRHVLTTDDPGAVQAFRHDFYPPMETEPVPESVFFGHSDFRRHRYGSKRKAKRQSYKVTFSGRHICLLCLSICQPDCQTWIFIETVV